jgi:hypothetical protein
MASLKNSSARESSQSDIFEASVSSIVPSNWIDAMLTARTSRKALHDQRTSTKGSEALTASRSDLSNTDVQRISVNSSASNREVRESRAGGQFGPTNGALEVRGHVSDQEMDSVHHLRSEWRGDRGGQSFFGSQNECDALRSTVSNFSMGGASVDEHARASLTQSLRTVGTVGQGPAFEDKWTKVHGGNRPLDLMELNRQLKACRGHLSDESAAVSELRDRLSMLKTALVSKSECSDSRSMMKAPLGNPSRHHLDCIPDHEPRSRGSETASLSENQKQFSQQTAASSAIFSDCSLRRVFVHDGKNALAGLHHPSHLTALPYPVENDSEGLCPPRIALQQQSAAILHALMKEMETLRSDVDTLSLSWKAEEAAQARAGQPHGHERNHVSQNRYSGKDGESNNSSTSRMHVKLVLMELIKQQDELASLLRESMDCVQDLTNKDNAARSSIKQGGESGFNPASRSDNLENIARSEMTALFAAEIRENISKITSSFEELVCEYRLQEQSQGALQTETMLLEPKVQEQSAKLKLNEDLVCELQLALASEKSRSLLSAEIWQKRLKEMETAKTDVEARLESTGNQLAKMLGGLSDTLVKHPRGPQSGWINHPTQSLLSVDTTTGQSNSKRHSAQSQSPTTASTAEMPLSPSEALSRTSSRNSLAPPEPLGQLGQGQQGPSHAGFTAALQARLDAGLAGEATSDEKQQRRWSQPTGANGLQAGVLAGAQEVGGDSRPSSTGAMVSRWRTVRDNFGVSGKGQPYKGPVQSI